MTENRKSIIIKRKGRKERIIKDCKIRKKENRLYNSNVHNTSGLGIN